MLGIAKAGGSYGNDKHSPLWIFRSLRRVKMNVIENADFIAHDMRSKPLIPIIFSHGLSSNRTLHSGTCKDLASHGYIVLIMDHRDGTSSYYETKDGKGYYYDNSKKLHDLEMRQDMI